ncbi:hypothetical protein CBR_g46009 [Chara braunii]|uniref:Integrase catalytic domain-containing protein n=1 Tax=Chara braunii TaxID=69332 RepID=A0A388M044_CHABU|nr:hypothetical protein CBR_g46009 [Chara braunii]|eukprot:GBG87853.1 hypothetical protein CBR_g46009 [Chara braunii]
MVLDGVLHPEVLKNELIFRREGWNYHLQSPNDTLTVEGVAWNEMLWRYSSSSFRLVNTINKVLFPDTPYAFESGGYPYKMINLTYEDLKDFHRRFYHPSNIFISMYGDDDAVERLRFLSGAFANFTYDEEVKANSKISPLSFNSTLPYTTVTFPSTGDDPQCFVMAWLLEMEAGLHMEDKINLELVEGLLKSALFQYGLDITFDNDNYANPVFYILFCNTTIDAPSLESGIMETFESAIKTGISDADVSGILINTLLVKNMTYGEYSLSNGKSLHSSMLAQWKRGGDPLEALNFTKAWASVFDRVTDLELVKPSFETMVQYYVLNNTNRAAVHLVPEAGGLFKIKAKLEGQLAAWQRSLSEDEIQQLVNNTRILDEYARPAGLSVTSIIPSLSWEDLKLAVPKQNDKVYKIGAATVVENYMDTHGFFYVDIAFDLARIPQDLIPYVGWIRCPMRICNAPATFQRAMNMAFAEFVNKTRLTQPLINFCVIVYMDDILVFSKTYEYHVEHIEWVLHALKDAGFKVALEKSEFFLSEISFLGYIVTVEGLKPDPRNVAAAREAPAPVTLTQVRAFLGLASYYRRFIRSFACLAKPLTNLLKKEEQLIWTPECEAAFQALKEALTSAPVLARPDPTRQFALHTEWQPQAISAVLTQQGTDGREHAIEYASKTLSQAQSNYEACKGDLLTELTKAERRRVTERAHDYRWQGSVLQKRKDDDVDGSSWLTVPHPQARFDWTRAAHEEDAVHFAVKYTEKAIEKNGWYWSGIREDVKYIVRTCLACAADKAPIQMPRTIVPTRVERPFQRVSIDTTDINVPRGPVDQGELNVLLVAVYHFSKWIEAYPMTSWNSQEVAWYSNHFLWMHLDVEEIHMDNGSEFHGEVERHLVREDIRISYSPGHRPQANGLVENANRMIKTALRRNITAGDTRPWPVIVDHILAIYRATPHGSTGVSPFQLRTNSVPRVQLSPLVGSRMNHRQPEHEPLEHFQTPLADRLLRHQFNEERQLRYDIQQVNMPTHGVVDLVAYSLLCDRLTYAGVYVDVTQLPGRETTRVFIEFRALQVAPNFVHSVATFIGDLTILPQPSRELARSFVRQYAVQAARSVGRVQGRGAHRFTAHEALLRRVEDGPIALGPYPMREFSEYLVELTDVEPLPFADEDVWELHCALYKSVALGMFRFFVDHEDHCIGEHFVAYYVIMRPKPAQKEGTVALYPFAQLQTTDPGLLELIHLELLSIAQVIASEEEEIQPRLRMAAAPRRTYNVVVIPDYIAERKERLEDFPEEKPLRPPSSYPRPAPPKALKKTPKRKRHHPSLGAQGSQIGAGEEVVQPVRTRNLDPVPGSGATLVKETVVPSPPLPRVPDLNHDGAGPSAAAAGGGSRMGLPDPVSRPPVLAGPLRFRQPPRSAPILTLAVPPSRTVHPIEVDFMVEPTTIRLEAIVGAPRPDPAWEPYLTPSLQGCIAARLAGTLIYETGRRPNVMYHFLVFAAQKGERRPYTETHLVMTGPGPRSVRKRVVRAVADLAPRVLHTWEQLSSVGPTELDTDSLFRISISVQLQYVDAGLKTARGEGQASPYFIISGKTNLPNASLLIDEIRQRWIRVQINNPAEYSGASPYWLPVEARLDLDRPISIEELTEAIKAMPTKLEEAYRNFIHSDGVSISVIGNQSAIKNASKALKVLVESLPSPPTPQLQRVPWTKLDALTNESVPLPLLAFENLRSRNVYKGGWAPAGSSSVITKVQNAWINHVVRVRRHAYGGGAAIDEGTGLVYHYSTADPQILRTLQTFDESANFLESITEMDEDLDRIKVTAVAQANNIKEPYVEGMSRFWDFLTNVTIADYERKNVEINTAR